MNFQTWNLVIPTRKKNLKAEYVEHISMEVVCTLFAIIIIII